MKLNNTKFTKYQNKHRISFTHHTHLYYDLFVFGLSITMKDLYNNHTTPDYKKYLPAKSITTPLLFNKNISDVYLNTQYWTINIFIDTCYDACYIKLYNGFVTSITTEMIILNNEFHIPKDVINNTTDISYYHRCTLIFTNHKDALDEFINLKMNFLPKYHIFSRKYEWC